MSLELNNLSYVNPAPLTAPGEYERSAISEPDTDRIITFYDPDIDFYVWLPTSDILDQEIILPPRKGLEVMELLDQRFYNALVVPSRSVPIFKQRGNKGPFIIRSYSSVEEFSSLKSVGPHHFIGKNSRELLNKFRVPEWISYEQVEIFSETVAYCSAKNLRHNPVALAVIKKRDHKMIHAMYEHNPYFGLTLDIQLAIPSLVQLILNDSNLRRLPDKYYPSHAKEFLEKMRGKLEIYLGDV